MVQNLTESIQQTRVMVVEIDRARGRLRVKGIDACTDLSCAEQTVVVSDEGTSSDLAVLNPGDLVKVESPEGGPTRIVVVRRAWEEIASPEL